MIRDDHNIFDVLTHYDILRTLMYLDWKLVETPNAWGIYEAPVKDWVLVADFRGYLFSDFKIAVGRDFQHAWERLTVDTPWCIYAISVEELVANLHERLKGLPPNPVSEYLEMLCSDTATNFSE
jgi:hypothetical protein